MNVSGCRAILGELQASFPHRAMSDSEMVIWLDTLAPFHAEDARVALRGLRQISEWLPSHAKFIECAAVARAHRAERDKPRELTDATGEPVSKAEAKANIARLRRLMHEQPIKRP